MLNMQIKKNPKYRLENYSKIFFQIGLVLALFITYCLIEIKSYDRIVSKDLSSVNMEKELEEDIPIIPIEKIKPPTKTPPVVVEQIKVVKDDLKIEETIVESTEIDEGDAVIVNTESIEEVEEAEDIVEDIPFVLIEDVPVYPGCKGTNKEIKDCFTVSIRKFFVKNFDAGLAQDLGLSPGKKKIFVTFKISNKGKVININARAPHPKLKKEVIEIISTLPQMIPGKQRGKPVGVKYSLPITFLIK